MPGSVASPPGRAPLPLLPTTLLATLLLLASSAAAATYTPVHVAFLTDCSKYSNWQSLAMIFSFKMSGQPGTLTRVMCCSPEDTKAYPPLLLKEVETHVAPSFNIHPVTGDNYAAYNKPEAVIDWLQKVTPKEEYVLVLDSDMILRRPFLVEEMQPKPGLAIGNRYTYMIGVANDLAMRHVPQVVPRNDTLAGPMGRRGDQVGGFFFIHRDDLKRMSKGWLKYTEDVRADTEAYKDSGDMYAIHPGDKPWISEMYGYSFGASTADVWHKWDTTSMIYPYGAYDHGSRGPTVMPKLMHYGLLSEVLGYKFDKHWFYELDVTHCPPWDMTKGLHNTKTGGLFDHPPRISELTKTSYLPTYYRDLLVIETSATMNAGLCDYYVRNCPPSRQLLEECSKAFQIYKEAADECRAVESQLSCLDTHEKCGTWAKAGECEKNKEYMEETCKKSCDKCVAGETSAELKPLGAELEKNLGALRATLAATEGKGSPSGVTPAEGSPVAATASSPGAALASPSAADAAPSPQVQEEAHSQVLTLALSRSRSTKTRKELIVRCYRMQLDLDEVKECVKDARDMFEYERKKAARALTEDQDLLVKDKDKEGKGAGEGVSASPPASRRPLHAPTSPALLGLWQVAGVAAVVLVVVLTAVPRIRSFRRRAKSGMRLD